MTTADLLFGLEIFNAYLTSLRYSTPKTGTNRLNTAGSPLISALPRTGNLTLINFNCYKIDTFNDRMGTFGNSFFPSVLGVSSINERSFCPVMIYEGYTVLKQIIAFSR